VNVTAFALGVGVMLGAAGGAAGTDLRVADLLAMRPTNGTFTLIGYVAKSYRCPPCPQGAMCKPCMGANVVLSDEPRRINLYTELGPGDVIVFVTDSDLAKLVVGKRYRFRVEVGTRSSTSLPINDLRLVKWESTP